jgi:hypothetical protein
MCRPFVAFVLLLALLALLPMSRAVAGPPQSAPGRMVLERDEVSEALLRYRRESDPHRRLALLTDLAATHDPRVAVALGQALYDPRSEVRTQAAFGILFNQSGQKVKKMLTPHQALDWAREWWAANEDDLKRLARRLP